MRENISATHHSTVSERESERRMREREGERDERER
jgi:hypothetical protein